MAFIINRERVMKKKLLLILFVSLCSCSEKSSNSPDSLFEYVHNNSEFFGFGDFYIVSRSETNSYLYRNNDYKVEYWFVLTSDSINPFKYFKEGEEKSDEYLNEKFKSESNQLKKVINKTIHLVSLLIKPYNLDGVYAHKDQINNLTLIFSSKDKYSLVYSQSGQLSGFDNNKLLKNYNDNWFLVNK
jgi:hypothetical protein